MPRKAGEAKEAKPAGEKKASGLTKPMALSPELAAIVGAKKDEKLAR
jgi:chromatin remodeling complex protein RSC6